MATECRLVLSHVVGERSQKIADKLVANTAKMLRSIPLFVTDGLKLYTIALRKQYGKLQLFAPTGKRGRPRSPKLIVDELFTIRPNVPYIEVPLHTNLCIGGIDGTNR